MAKILSIIAPNDFQDIEYSDSKSALEKSGHEVITASSQPQTTGKFGLEVTTDILISKIDPENYDAIAFIGGPGVYQFFENKRLQDLAKTFYKSGKPTCAICAAPVILANAGLLQDKKSTCWDGEGETIQSKGALYSGNDVEVDGNIITANGPASAKKFGETIAKALK
ncbi:MAG: DJ-1 family protein [Nitrospirae bacterium]|nr:DJ-1 family protein [Nitrospirota bacterium]